LAKFRGARRRAEFRWNGAREGPRPRSPQAQI